MRQHTNTMLVCLGLALAASGCAEQVAADDVPLPTGPRLKDLAPDDGSVPLLIGATFKKILMRLKTKAQR